MLNHIPGYVLFWAKLISNVQNIVIAVTGASGSVYAKVLLDKLLTIKDQWDKIGLVMSANARTVWQHELGNEDYNLLESRFAGAGKKFRQYAKTDFNAPFASGSGQYQTMIVVPCSMGTLGRIAHGISDDLVTRAADVVLKERRKLILVVRDTPYNLIHIKNMEMVSMAGGIICPATPSFYSKPQTIEEVAATVIDRVLDLAGFSLRTYRWGGEE
jgi:4-hydroxy-3-polyprenylbenzoate decarboxylase